MNKELLNQIIEYVEETEIDMMNEYGTGTEEIEFPEFYYELIELSNQI